jgi:hypothetical protein
MNWGKFIGSPIPKKHTQKIKPPPPGKKSPLGYLVAYFIGYHDFFTLIVFYLKFLLH